MKKPEAVLRELELGYLSDELTFNLEKPLKIDWYCLQYSYWTEKQYWETRLPAGLLDQFPCLQYMADELYEANKDKTPLDEINERMGLYAKKIAN